MGQLFQQGGLTQPGSALVTPSTGQPSMIGSPDQVTAMEHQLRDQRLQSAANNPVMAPKPQLPFQTAGTPSFQQAATAGATPGGANALSPGLNKAGKLVTLLTSGLQGALAGRAASEQTVAATGGRRSGGAGMGFEAGYTLPWQRAAQQNQLAQQQAQTEALKAQSQMIQTPSGPIPAWLAKAVMPAQIRGEATTEAAGIGAGGRTKAAEIGAAARIKAAQLGLGPIAQVPQELQDQFGLPAELPLRMLNQAEGAANRPLTTVYGQNDAYTVNRQTNKKTPLGVGNRAAGAALARPVVVAPDPNNPGNLTYMPAGKAMATGAAAPGSAPVQAAKGIAKSATSGKIGEEINAFNTALQHADLLKSAVMALGNGDQTTLNSLKNRFKAEFGVSGPVSAQVIADAYTREINKMLSAGHITDAEIGAIGKTLNVNRQSPQQALGALDAYRALATSKMNMRRQQVEQGMKGKANFPKPADATHVVPGPDGKNHYTNAQGTVDLGVAP